jgi:hypothetical protein
MRFGWSSRLKVMASSDQLRKEGGAFSALAGRHVDGGSPKDEEHVLHGGEAARVAISSIFLGLRFLRGGAAIKLLEHIALLKGVVHWVLW